MQARSRVLALVLEQGESGRCEGTRCCGFGVIARKPRLPELGSPRPSSSIPCVLGCHISCSPPVMGVMTTTTGGTAVLEKVFYTSVLVSDQDKALDFYTNVLGLEKRV